MNRITNEEQYQKALEEVYRLMNRSEESMTDMEAKRIQSKALQIQAYEKEYYPFPILKAIHKKLRNW